MTVKPENKIDQDLPVSMKAVIPVREMSTDAAAEAEQESGGSSTEEVDDSPRSVAKFGRRKGGLYVHNQVLRVKEEELLLREDIDGEGCCLISNNKDRKKNENLDQERHANVVVFSRPTPILPCSPLSGKTITTTTAVKTVSH